jgi:sulfate permease, SulP family
MINFLEALNDGKFGKGRILPNIVAGIIVGIVALPLAMAFAIASGVRPEQGIYTAIIAGFLVSMFGGSSTQIAGPTGAFIVILSGITATHGVSGLQIATIMAGVMLLLMGFAKLGAVIKFIPAPVIVGFTAGIGVIIWVGQWKYFFGFPALQGEHFHERLVSSLQALPHLHWPTAAVGVGSLGLVTLSGKLKWLRPVPGPLIAMVAATALQYCFQFDGVATIGSAFGGIPQHLPKPTLPEWTASRVIELMGPAFTIAILGAIESLLSAVVADGMTGTKHNSNQELIGQGVANIATPFFGGFAATGAIARTATSIRNGGTSPIAGVTHAATLLLTVLILAPMAAHVPLSTLAAILFVVAFNMSELKHVVRLIRLAPVADVVILVVTFLLTVFADLVVAVNIGVILAMLQFLRRMASAVEVELQTEAHLRPELADQGLQKMPPGVLVYAIEGPIFFGAVENFERALALSHTDPQVLVLRLRRVPFMDISGLLILEEVVGKLLRRGVRVLLCEANARVKAKLVKVGLMELVGPANYADSFSQALEQCLEWTRLSEPPPTDKEKGLGAAARRLIKTSEDFFLSGKK